ncbi:MAG: protein TolQ, partial [Alphaproteobacteria bacterium]
NSSISVINLLIQADIIVQIVILALVFASLFSWALIFDKILKFRVLKKRSDEFEEYFENGAKIEEVFNKTKNNDNHPLARIFLACIKEWKLSNIKQIITDGSDKKSALKERLNNAMTVATNRSLVKLEAGLNYMAIIGSSAPFVGLFGTVWGILNSFQSIAVSKNTSLAVVAPGIAESLLATAIGLFAAIPAVFFYNVFTAKINQFNERANNFSLLLLNALSKELDK